MILYLRRELIARIERTDPNAQEEFREDAHNLLKTVLDKNNEADNRRVCLVSVESGHCDIR